MRNFFLPKTWIIVAFMISSFYASGQENEKKFGIDFTGFVKADIFWDTRQTVSVREGHFLLWPSPEVLDENGEDINARPNFNLLTIQTRLRGNIKGPDVLGAKSSGAIEGEFFGHSNGDINGFRLRHAYVKLDWTKHTLLIGQYWHPMFVTTCFPGTVSFNTGAPFLVFSRNPQVRYVYSPGAVKFFATIMSQMDFISNGPAGPSRSYLRNSAIPALNLRLEYNRSNEETGRSFQLGISGNYKTLRPRLVTDLNFKADETVSSFAAQAYLKVKCEKLTFKASGVYGQDTYDWTMIGGYAVKSITDEATGMAEYIPLSTMTAWAEIHTNGAKLQFGLFGGYTKNLGASEEYTGDVYARGGNIDYAYRISPRLIYNINKFRIAPELEYTVAAYGMPNEKGEVQNAEAVGNFRVLLGVYYFF